MRDRDSRSEYDRENERRSGRHYREGRHHRDERHRGDRYRDRHDRNRDYCERSSRDERHRDERHHEHPRRDRYESERRRSISPTRSPDHSRGSPRSPVEKPNFAPSGLLAKESNNVNGVALKYHEPPEARRPPSSWRLYVFKDDKEVGASILTDMLVLGRQSCYLIGRDRVVVDIATEHPSISKQHAVIQFRLVIKRNEFGDESRSIKYVLSNRPFLIDLDSANGTTVNAAGIPKSRYYELRHGDTCRFGGSTREYVLLDEAAAP